MSTELNFRAAVDAARARGDLDDLATTQLILADYLDDNGRQAEAGLVREAAWAIEAERANDLPGVSAAGGSAATRQRVLYRTSRWPSPDELPGLSDHQRERLGQALVRPLGILTGTPGCLHGDTPIHDPVDGTTLTVRERERAGKPFHVWARGERGTVVIAEAERPWKYEPAEMLRFTFTSGRSVTVTKGHRFWDGKTYRAACAVSEQLQADDVCRLPSISDIDLSTRIRDARHSMRKAEGYSDRCSLGSCLCGGQPLQVRGIDRLSFPSLDDAPLHTLISSHEDGPEHDDTNTGDFSLRVLIPLAITDYVRRIASRSAEAKAHLPVAMLGRQHVYSRSSCGRSGLPISLGCSTLQSAAFVRKKLERPCDASCGFVMFSECSRDDQLVKVESAGVQPYYDFHVPGHENYWAEGFFHHNTGKTHALSALVVYLSRHYGPSNIAVCAPTGKAAQRCKESIKNYLEIPENRQLSCETPTPTTIHSLLRIGRNGHDGRGWGFEFHRRNPLPYRFVIVDEASMLSCSLAASLLPACADRAHVLLVGDTGQLPPVGHGSPLRDAISAGVPHGELTEIRRNAGLIVRACAAMRRGETYQPADKFDPDAGLNWRHIEIASPDEIVPTVKALLAGWKRTNLWNPLSDVQVVCALNDKGPMSRQLLNRELQELLNPSEQAAWAAMGGEWGVAEPVGQSQSPPRFRTGDKVMCLRNGWYQTEDSPNDTQYVANGEQGNVLDGQHAQTLVTFGDRAIMLRPSDWSDFDLAYACTAHKAQGCAWPVVIVVVDRFAGRVCCREWWYTALSRASELVITVGRFGLLRQQAGRPALANRKTALRELIEEGMRDVL